VSTNVGHRLLRLVSYATTPLAEKIARGWSTGGGSRNRLKPQGSREFSLSSHSHRDFLSLSSIPHSSSLSSLILAMFFNTQLLVSAIMAVSVLGAPSAKRQDAGPACNGLGSGVYSNRGHFKVAAFNPNGPNDHAYGTELIQGTTGADAGTLTTTFTVSTTNSSSRCTLPNRPPYPSRLGPGTPRTLGCTMI